MHHTIHSKVATDLGEPPGSIEVTISGDNAQQERLPKESAKSEYLNHRHGVPGGISGVRVSQTEVEAAESQQSGPEQGVTSRSRFHAGVSNTLGCTISLLPSKGGLGNERQGLRADCGGEAWW
jgi:hypothetical protein